MTFLDRYIIFLANKWLYRRYYDLIWAARQRHTWWPDVAYPKRYSERMLWRKIVDHNPDFVIFSDKLATKVYTAERCPELPIPRTLWVGTDSDAIPDELLRREVYLKANHGSGFNLHIRGGEIDRVELKKQTDAWLAETYGTNHGEWSYTKVVPKLFIEELIGNGSSEMVEFEFRVANGRVLFTSMVGRNKTPEQWRVYLDDEGELGPAPTAADKSTISESPLTKDHRPAFRRARDFAIRLGHGVDYSRIDIFWDGTQVFGGEITIYPGAGILEIASPVSNAIVLGGWRLLDAGFFVNKQPWPMSIYANALRRTLLRAEKTEGLAQTESVERAEPDAKK